MSRSNVLKYRLDLVYRIDGRTSDVSEHRVGMVGAFAVTWLIPSEEIRHDSHSFGN